MLVPVVTIPLPIVLWRALKSLSGLALRRRHRASTIVAVLLVIALVGGTMVRARHVDDFDIILVAITVTSVLLMRLAVLRFGPPNLMT
jgi:hypothetical protein